MNELDRIRSVYERIGAANAVVDDWRTDPGPGFDDTQPMRRASDRQALRRESRDRDVRLVKTALIACFLAIILGVGFVAGTVWEGWHWQATCKR